VHLLLDRRGHRVGHHLRAGARILRGHNDRRRRDFRILRDRESDVCDQSEQHDDDGRHGRENRTRDEEVREFHDKRTAYFELGFGCWVGGVAMFGLPAGCGSGFIVPCSAFTVTPGRTRMMPLMITVSSGLSPSFTMRRPLLICPSVTLRRSALLSAPTTKTYFCPWSEPMASSLINTASKGGLVATCTRRNMPGSSDPLPLGKIPRINSVPVAAL